MAADFSKPTTASNYTDFPPEIRANIEAVAKQDYAGASNTPTNAIKWATDHWEKYNGSTWDILATLYSINISGTAAKLAGGVAGAISYQSATDVTGFSSAGTTGQPLLSGGTGVPTFGTLGTSFGGTGATGPTGARTNLGAAAAGTNSDITSLAAVTTLNNGSFGGFRNRIHNGDFSVNQLGITAWNGFGGGGGATIEYMDRWKGFGKYTSGMSSNGTVTLSALAPAGFGASLLYTNAGALAIDGVATRSIDFGTLIEGPMIKDLGFGAGGGAPFTLSFYVKSTLTGAFSGTLRNMSGTRHYPFSFSISAAGTWERKSVTVTPCADGSWSTAAGGTGLQIAWNLGCSAGYKGTANTWSSTTYYGVTGQVDVVATGSSTFAIAGVQLEKGSVATDFEFRSYDIELMLCKRYLWVLVANSTTYALGTGGFTSSTAFDTHVKFDVPLMATPSALWASGNNIITAGDGAATYVSSGIAARYINKEGVNIITTVSGATTYRAGYCYMSTNNGYMYARSEFTPVTPS